MQMGLYDTLGQLDPSSEAAFDFADEAVKRILDRYPEASPSPSSRKARKTLPNAQVSLK